MEKGTGYLAEKIIPFLRGEMELVKQQKILLCFSGKGMLFSIKWRV